MLTIIQARMSSRRLPGKVLMPLGGRPMLAWTLERVAAAAGSGRVVVATSDDPGDDAVEAFCRRQGVTCHRGPLDDVAARFAMVARAEGATAFMRVNGDSPLIDPAILEMAVRLYRQNACDLVTNTQVRSFPKGQSVEVVRSAAFERLLPMMRDGQDREHVTLAFYAFPDAFAIVNFESGEDAAALQLSVDTPQDFDAAARLIEQSGGRPGGWRDLLRLKAGQPA